MLDRPPDLDSQHTGTPRWVKVFGLVALVLVVLVVILAIFGGGKHGPGRHSPAGETSGGHTGPPPGMTHADQQP